jgi:hypothetical protein
LTHGIDARTRDRPRTVIGDEDLPPARIEGGTASVDGDLHLAGCGRRGSGSRVDRAMADKEQGSMGSPSALQH